MRVLTLIFMVLAFLVGGTCSAYYLKISRAELEAMTTVL
jgi:hypothetical protein